MGLMRIYLENMLIYMMIALPFYVLGRMIFIKLKKCSVNKLREVILAGFTLYMIGLASQTIIPSWSAGNLTDTGEFYFTFHIENELASVNLIPLRTLNHYFILVNHYKDDWGNVSFVNFWGNILLFSPIGFFVPYLWNRFDSFIKILMIGLGVTFFIETVQYFIGRSTDVDDIILNTCGVLIGYGVFKLRKKK